MTHLERRERRRLIAERVKGGASVPDASRAFGVTVEMVCRACAEHGVKVLRVSKVLERDAAIVEMVKDGATVAAVLKRFKIGYDSMRKVCSNHGVCVPQSALRRRKGARRAAMAKMIQGGASPLQVARKFSVTRQTIYNACDEHGVTCLTTRTSRNESLARQRSAMAEMIRQDKPVKAVCAHYRVSDYTVRRACKEHGILLARRNALPRLRWFQILAAILSGDTQMNIAHALNVSQACVSDVKLDALAAGIK
ncbi:MAG: hypothetical protein IMZ50_06145, partial [Candidatus Atribacteria bacterium]|nr:hypothetical protein [Candidatus Atribacteria bacterium]